LTTAAWGSTEYYRHVVFDNSLTSDTYFYSHGLANGSSFLELKDNRLPVETKTFLTPPNALRLRWQSQPGGGWEGEVRVDSFRNRFPEFKGHNLYFWCFAQEAIAADDLPMILLSSTSEGLQVAEFPSAFSGPCRWERWREISLLENGSRSEFRYLIFTPARSINFVRSTCGTSFFIRAATTVPATL
jgi:hypothetical protein